MNYDLVIIGGGPAGMAAAIEARKNKIKDILILERDKELGGVLFQCIHSGFGLQIFKEELTGPEYAQKYIDEIDRLSIEYKLETMGVDINSDKEIRALNKSDGLIKIKAKAIILAMGCRERTRGSISIAGTRPAGIFSAGTAQRYINIEGYMVGSRVVILGSGDIGLIMARRLTLEGVKVVAVVEIMEKASGLDRNVAQCLEDYDIPLLLNHTISEIRGKDRVSSVLISQVDKKLNPIKTTEKEYQCDTVLFSIGLIPENELSKKIGLDFDSYTKNLKVDRDMSTSVKGIYACGNVVHVHDIVDKVTEESMLAGKSASKYILALK